MGHRKGPKKTALRAVVRNQQGPDVGPRWRVVRCDLEGVEQQIGIEAIEFDHDPGGDGEPDRCEDRGGGEEFFHGDGWRPVNGGRWLNGERR